MLARMQLEESNLAEDTQQRPSGGSGSAAPRWRRIVVRVLAVALVLALFQGLLYRSYSSAQQQAAAGSGQPLAAAFRWRIAGHDLTLSLNQAQGSTSGSSDASSDGGSANGSSGSRGAAGGTAEQPAQVQPAEQADEQQPSADTARPAAEQQGQPTTGGSGDAGSGSGSSGGAGLACEESGLCSVGKVRHWRGDIATNEQLRAMLEAVSYKREVMFVTTGMPTNPYVINIVEDAKALGLGHIFVLVWEESKCGELPEAYRDAVSCAWDSRRSLESANPFNDLLAKRWEVTARALRMGYNVLSLDDDVSLLDDPYRYYKFPPLSRYNAHFHRDGNYYNGVNCGIMYWQNCHPSGPAVHMVVELADCTLRQREDPAAMKAVYTDSWRVEDMTWEQNTWDDIVNGMATGRPVILAAPGEPNMNKDWFRENLEAHAASPLYGARLRRLDQEWPQAWRQRTLYPRGPLEVVEDMRYPIPPNDTWWAQHAKHFYPPQRRASSAAFIQLVRDASPLPLYEVGQPWTQPADVPGEGWAYISPWLAGTQVTRGQHGFWALEPPAAVIAHGAYSFGPAGSGLWKRYVAKGHGWWHWEVSERINGGNLLGLPGKPRLLMLAPGVALHTETEEAFQEAVVKFARLAEALGRRFVPPNPPCDSVRLGVFANEHTEYKSFQPDDPADAQVHTWPDRYDGMSVIQFPDLVRRRRGRRGASYCHWIRGLTNECVAAMPPYVDAQAYLERALTPEQATPGEANTLWLAEWREAGGEEGPLARQQQGQQHEVRPVTAPAVALPSAAAVVEAAGQLAAAPVLFLGAVPSWGDGEAGLPAIPEALKSCYLFQPAAERPLETSPTTTEGQANRQARLNGTAAAAGAAGAAAAQRRLF
ncbi:hypothetical protein ABPG75_009450 [Micractinium tetrahymenae]